MLRVSNIKLSADHSNMDLKLRAAKKLGVPPERICSLKISKKSVDAREKPEIFYVYSVDAEVKGDARKLLERPDVLEAVPYVYRLPAIHKRPDIRPVVAGSGPAGLFAALILAEAGLKPVILEQGKSVDERSVDVEEFWARRVLNPWSNVQFGEGGAGTFSDGKLNTGLKDELRAKVIQEFLNAGAPEEIEYLAKPHIGTDKLIGVLRGIRAKIEALGGEYRFGNRLTDIYGKNRLEAVAVSTDTGIYELAAERLVLAVGHSSRTTFEMLHRRGIILEPKAFSVGVRIEHSQKMINISQYGSDRTDLPAAEYKLSARLKNGRGVYTFCMCPGGSVVAAASEPETVVTNGMSLFARCGVNANSAVLVSVMPEDFYTGSPLDGIAFQRGLERDAFIAGGGNYSAPAQLVGDFLKGRGTTAFGRVAPSYRPGVAAANLTCFLPEFVTEGIKVGLLDFEKRIKGFASPDAVLTGVETRSSSPVTVKRDGMSLMSAGLQGVYPCGEGAGYAGGIISAAIDGIRVAERVIGSIHL